MKEIRQNKIKYMVIGQTNDNMAFIAKNVKEYIFEGVLLLSCINWEGTYKTGNIDQDNKRQPKI